MRVEITIDKRNYRQLPDNGVAAIEEELQNRLLEQYPDIGIRVKLSTATSVKVTGGSKDQSATVNQIVEQMLAESSEWMPE